MFLALSYYNIDICLSYSQIIDLTTNNEQTNVPPLVVASASELNVQIIKVRFLYLQRLNYMHTISPPHVGYVKCLLQMFN
jgi:hypothetical protein